jgi:hypothetical protein
MSHSWPMETAFRSVELDVEDRICQHCGQWMHVCGRRKRRLFTLQGPLQLLLKVVHCPVQGCSGHSTTWSPEAELNISMPWWVIGWDVFLWIGHRRLSRHWSVPQIRTELHDSYRVDLSEDAVEKNIRRYQTMIAARQQDLDRLRACYQDSDVVKLTIDGLQPEKGHETIYVVREVGKKRLWFAEPLLSSSEAEVRRLFVRARQIAEYLGKPVAWWMSDKQDAFVKGVAAEFPGTVHRYCQNHFLRDLAEPVLKKDSHAKVKMRTKVRGLRAIEREVLTQQKQQEQQPQEQQPQEQQPQEPAQATEKSSAEATGALPSSRASSSREQADIVLEYCAAVRGILNDDQGGPLHPPSLRMAEALNEVQESLQRNLEAKKGGLRKVNCGG